MRHQLSPTSFKLWLSAADTYNWAHRPGSSWPCSTLSDNRLFVEFDSNGLCDISVNGGNSETVLQHIDGHELNAAVADHAARLLPQDHPLHFIVVGQFQEPQKNS